MKPLSTNVTTGRGGHVGVYAALNALEKKVPAAVALWSYLDLNPQFD